MDSGCPGGHIGDQAHSAVAGLRLWPCKSRIGGTVASALASLLLHGGALAAVFYLIEQKPGAIEAPTEAISIELFASEVLEAVERSASLTATASTSSIQSEAGAAENSPATAQPAGRPEPIEPTEQVVAKEAPAVDKLSDSAPRGLDLLQGADEYAEQSGREKKEPPKNAETSESRSKPVEDRITPSQAAKPAAAAETRKTEGKPSKKGGASSRATKGSAASSGRISASTGSAINYAALVRARVAGRKPPGSGRRGTVVVSFGVSHSGGLSHASVARSSGDAGLDRSVLSAVRSAGPFPAPPPGARLQFVMPFYFR